ncbi:hypothetical protein [Haladaptatus sp. DJG-WS-42]|uniref:hypothetical protein n=1 Tax=Haladaptatus sp. DJG-WS-42 TaxID=3120516 RepID=UPI0030D155F3
MVSTVGLIGLLVIIGVNALVAALMTRFFRVRLSTTWGTVLYSLILIPIVLVVLTLILSGVARLGPNLGSTGAVMAVAVALPFALGVAFDFFWMPAPDEVELPDTAR